MQLKSSQGAHAIGGGGKTLSSRKHLLWQIQPLYYVNEMSTVLFQDTAALVKLCPIHLDFCPTSTPGSCAPAAKLIPNLAMKSATINVLLQLWPIYEPSLWWWLSWLDLNKTCIDLPSLFSWVLSSLSLEDCWKLCVLEVEQHTKFQSFPSLPTSVSYKAEGLEQERGEGRKTPGNLS